MEVLILDNENFEAAIDKEKGLILGRLKKDTDLLNGILEVCDFYGIKAGTFHCIGSVLSLGYYQFNEKEDKTLEYSEPFIKNEPGEIVSGNGFIGLDENYELDVHYHGIYLDSKGNISGGHFIRGKNTVAVTLEFAIKFSDNIVLTRKPDSIFNIPIFHFNSKEN